MTSSSGPAPSALRCWLGLAGFYATTFATLGAYMVFFPGWLKSAGEFSADELSVVLAAQTIARTGFGPFWAHRVDRAGGPRGILVALAFASVAAFALFGVRAGMGFAFVAAFLFGSVYSPMFPIVDGAAMQAASERGFAYGRLRLCGSVSYLVIVVGLGQCLDRFGHGIVFPVLLATMAAMAVSSLALARAPVRPVAERERAPWWQPLRSRPFVLLLLATAAIQGSHATFYNLSTIHWLDHGISKTWASVLWAEGILAEIVLFAFARETVDRLRPTTLLLVGGGAAVVRWCVVAVTTSVPLLLATNWLHALSFGCTYLGALRALERRVPAHQRSTAQGLLGAANSGLGMVVCGVLGGVLYERWEGRAFFTMAAFAALGAGLAFQLRRMADQPRIATSSAASPKPE